MSVSGSVRKAKEELELQESFSVSQHHMVRMHPVLSVCSFVTLNGHFASAENLSD